MLYLLSLLLSGTAPLVILRSPGRLYLFGVIPNAHQAFANSDGEDYVVFSEYFASSPYYEPLGESDSTSITGADGQDDVVLMSTRSENHLVGKPGGATRRSRKGWILPFDTFLRLAVYTLPRVVQCETRRVAVAR